MKERILFEDNHLVVVVKKAGELVQGDSTGDQPLVEKVKKFLKRKYNKPSAVYLGVVHRLDRPTSGVVVFAKTSKALARLNDQFKKRVPKKTYWALVSIGFSESKGTLVHWMTRNTKQNKSKAHIREVPQSKYAKLHYSCIKTLKNYKLLEIQLETGRHHQIRAQLSTAGYPIQGDLKYGAARSNKEGHISLHATRLEINHPITKKAMIFTSNPPRLGGWKAVLSD